MSHCIACTYKWTCAHTCHASPHALGGASICFSAVLHTMHCLCNVLPFSTIVSKKWQPVSLSSTLGAGRPTWVATLPRAHSTSWDTSLRQERRCAIGGEDTVLFVDNVRINNSNIDQMKEKFLPPFQRLDVQFVILNHLIVVVYRPHFQVQKGALWPRSFENHVYLSTHFQKYRLYLLSIPFWHLDTSDHLMAHNSQ